MPKEIKHPSGRLLSGPEALRKRPDLAALMMDIISLWSLLEQHIAMMFACLLHGETNDSLEVYFSFFDSSPRKRIFDALSESRLSKPLRIEIEKFFQSLRKIGKIRHEIAHGLWGASDSYPDCILLEDNKHSVQKFVVAWKQTLKGGANPDQDLHAGMTLSAYYKADFIAALATINAKSVQSLDLGKKIVTELYYKSK